MRARTMLSFGVAMALMHAVADNSRLVAHRGDASRFPQNTLEAIKSAVENGAGMIEIDVVRCKTGELIVYGERDLEEATDGTGVVAEATFDYLRSLSAHAPKKFGDKFKGRYSPYQCHCLGLRATWCLRLCLHMPSGSIHLSEWRKVQGLHPALHSLHRKELQADRQ